MKLGVSGKVPTPRYDHGACAVDLNRLVLYGGRSSNSTSLASDELHLLRYSPETKEAAWCILKTAGSKSPGNLYGHTLVFRKPYLVVFGGIRHAENDMRSASTYQGSAWLLNLDMVKKLEWMEIVSSNDKYPTPRAFHSADVLYSNQQ